MSQDRSPLHSYYRKIIRDVDDADWLLDEELEEQLEDDKDALVDMLKPTKEY
jgi:hypothetical protein